MIFCLFVLLLKTCINNKKKYISHIALLKLHYTGQDEMCFEVHDIRNVACGGLVCLFCAKYTCNIKFG